MKAFEQEYQSWLQQSDLLPELRQELEKISGDAAEREMRFEQVIPFGTAGMRGLMGAGINRMNVYTVCRAARGLAAWLNQTALPKRCAIGYDSRHNSRRFSEICAAALAETGIQVFLYHELAPTPMLSFAVRDLGCGCGIVISASHNDGRYNGMKCYGADGCQMTDEPAAAVFDEILKTPLFAQPLPDFEAERSADRVQYIEQAVWERYYDAVLAERVGTDASALAGLRLLYTPLNGAGNRPVREVLSRLGVQVQVVPAQEHPDGDFPTCPYPNPETDEALREAYRVADEKGLDLIIASDPDSDRLGVAARTGNGWRHFTGNELGCLLLHFILEHRKNAAECEYVRSIVSTPMADAIAAKFGCRAVSVLTGFKYIGGEILRLEELGREQEFLFGFEESCGYLKGTYVRDKDAVVAAMLVAELAADCAQHGRTLAEQMQELYATFGFYAAQVQSVQMDGLDGPAKIAGFVDALRASNAPEFAGKQILSKVDYRSGKRQDLKTGTSVPTGLPISNVYELNLEGGARIVVRPSGTEPKLKLYYSAVGRDEAAAQAALSALQAEMSGRLAALG